MSRVSLSPAARPVDMFAPGEVRGDAGAGDSVLQLAGALSRFKPELQQFSSDYMANKRNTAALEAESDFRKLQLKSMREFNAAVESGQIDAESNPWKASFMRQLVRREEFTALTNTVAQEYETDPVRADDNPEAVDRWLSQKLDPYMKDLRPDELRAVGESFDRFRGQFIGEHLTRRANERAAMGRQGLIAELSNTLAGSTLAGSTPAAEVVGPPSTAEVAGTTPAAKVAETINTRLAAARAHGFQPTEILGALTQALTTSNGRSIDDMQEIMDTIVLDGKSLQETLGAGTVERVKDTIANNIRREEEEAYSAEQRTYARKVNEAKEAVSVAWLNSKKTGKPFTEKDVFAALSTFSPEIQAQLALTWESVVKAGEQEAYRDVLGNGMERVHNGEPLDKIEQDVVAALLVMDQSYNVAAATKTLGDYADLVNPVNRVTEDDLDSFGRAQEAALYATSLPELIKTLKEIPSLTVGTQKGIIVGFIHRSRELGADLQDDQADFMRQTLKNTLTTEREDANGDMQTYVDPLYFEALAKSSMAFNIAASRIPSDLPPDQLADELASAAQTALRPYLKKATESKEAQAADERYEAGLMLQRRVVNDAGVITQLTSFTFTPNGPAVHQGPGSTPVPMTAGFKMFGSLKELRSKGRKTLDEMARGLGTPADFPAFVDFMRAEAVNYPDYREDAFLDSMAKVALGGNYDAWSKARVEEAEESQETSKRIAGWHKYRADPDLLLIIESQDGTRLWRRPIEGVPLDEYIATLEAAGLKVLGHRSMGYPVRIPTAAELLQAAKSVQEVAGKQRDDLNKVLSGK
jgi:hypothetical protein